MPDLSQSDVLLFIVAAVLIGIVSYFSLRKSSGYVDLVDHPPDENPRLHLGTSWPGDRPPADRAPTQEERAAADAQFDKGFYPRWSPQKRPYAVTSKPANGIGLRHDCFTLPQCLYARRGLSPQSWV